MAKQTTAVSGVDIKLYAKSKAIGVVSTLDINRSQQVSPLMSFGNKNVVAYTKSVQAINGEFTFIYRNPGIVKELVGVLAEARKSNTEAYAWVQSQGFSIGSNTVKASDDTSTNSQTEKVSTAAVSLLDLESFYIKMYVIDKSNGNVFGSTLGGITVLSQKVGYTTTDDSTLSIEYVATAYDYFKKDDDRTQGQDKDIGDTIET